MHVSKKRDSRLCGLMFDVCIVRLVHESSEINASSDTNNKYEKQIRGFGFTHTQEPVDRVCTQGQSPCFVLTGTTRGAVLYL